MGGVAGDPFSWGLAPFSGGGGIRSGRELQEKGRVGTRVHEGAQECMGMQEDAHGCTMTPKCARTRVRMCGDAQ